MHVGRSAWIRVFSVGVVLTELCVCVWVRMYACMHACMLVCMRACTDAFTDIYMFMLLVSFLLFLFLAYIFCKST